LILDSSALVAIAVREPRWEQLRDAVGFDPSPAVGAPTLVETAMVLAGRTGASARTMVARLLQDPEIDVIPFESDHWPVALDAFNRYGRGRHAAALNFGDCLTYATARLAGEPLLCLGNDFAQTDLEVVPL
jgi:ribonuclease VapC